MEDIISQVPVDAIVAELTPDKFMRRTNKGGNDIYIVTANDSPNIMREIGRLREITFRGAGGGTGKSADIDEYDTDGVQCKQLIVWDPDERIILGGYRYMLCDGCEFTENGQPRLATSHLFHFSEQFKKEYLPYTIELGRSFVQPDYQSSKAGAKALFALDNLWDGLGALSVDNPQMKYYFGKVTMYTHFNVDARNLILCFMNKHFKDEEKLIVPLDKYKLTFDFSKIEKLFDGADIKEDYRILTKLVREHGENIPPLVNAYINLSPTMKVFGTAVNDDFGDVEETGIILGIKDIYKAKIDRHIETYIKGNSSVNKI